MRTFISTLIVGAAFALVSFGSALAGPYGTGTCPVNPYGCPYPASTPKASYYETAIGTHDSPYTGWLTFGAQTAGGGGANK